MTSHAESQTFYHVYLHMKWPVSAAQQRSCHGKTLWACILVKTQSARQPINRRKQIFSLGLLNIRVHVFFFFFFNGFFTISLFCSLRGWRRTADTCSHRSPLEARLAEWTTSLVFMLLSCPIVSCWCVVLHIFLSVSVVWRSGSSVTLIVPLSYSNPITKTK